MDLTDLSKEAQQLIKLCFDSKNGKSEDVAKVLQENPKLMAGLNEYVNYVGEQRAETNKSKTTPQTSHSMLKLIDEF